MFSAYGFLLSALSFILFPLFKDCLFGNASLGKQLMRLKIVDIKTDRKVSVGQLVLRNITFYIPLIEFIMMLANHGNTIGDLITHTAVMERK